MNELNEKILTSARPWVNPSQVCVLLHDLQRSFPPDHSVLLLKMITLGLKPNAYLVQVHAPGRSDSSWGALGFAQIKSGRASHLSWRSICSGARSGWSRVPRPARVGRAASGRWGTQSALGGGDLAARCPAGLGWACSHPGRGCSVAVPSSCWTGQPATRTCKIHCSSFLPRDGRERERKRRVRHGALL